MEEHCIRVADDEVRIGQRPLAVNQEVEGIDAVWQTCIREGQGPHSALHGQVKGLVRFRVEHNRNCSRLRGARCAHRLPHHLPRVAHVRAIDVDTGHVEYRQHGACRACLAGGSATIRGLRALLLATLVRRFVGQDRYVRHRSTPLVLEHLLRVCRLNRSKDGLRALEALGRRRCHRRLIHAIRPVIALRGLDGLGLRVRLGAGADPCRCARFTEPCGVLRARRCARLHRKRAVAALLPDYVPARLDDDELVLGIASGPIPRTQSHRPRRVRIRSCCELRPRTWVPRAKLHR
mmetsp:Transcript_117329/g.339164  ORF Transcript_117329/g.339164 Transcript_117329/m.339164 type:complete len:292 (+) Transcript_117329:1276-2151(+)